MIFLYILYGLLWILGILLALAVILLVTPVKIGVIYPTLTVYLKWNGISYTVYPVPKWVKTKLGLGEEGEEHSDAAPDAKKQAEKTRQVESVEKPSVKPMNTTEGNVPLEPPQPTPLKNKVTKDSVEKVVAIIKIALECLGKIRGRAVVEKLYVDLIIADEDRAVTAQIYGGICAVAHPIMTLVEGTVKIKKQRINIRLDFERDDPAFGCDIIVSLRPIYAVSAVFAALIRIQKEGIKL